MNATHVTQSEITKILNEAKHADIGPQGTNKAAAMPAALSLAGFKALWPKVRPAVLFGVSMLQMFHRGDAAAGVAQFVAFVDLIVGGQLPIS